MFSLFFSFFSKISPVFINDMQASPLSPAGKAGRQGCARDGGRSAVAAQKGILTDRRLRGILQENCIAGCEAENFFRKARKASRRLVEGRGGRERKAAAELSAPRRWQAQWARAEGGSVFCRYQIEVGAPGKPGASIEVVPRIWVCLFVFEMNRTHYFFADKSSEKELTHS